jgi:hypothetical protein
MWVTGGSHIIEAGSIAVNYLYPEKETVTDENKTKDSKSQTWVTTTGQKREVDSSKERMETAFEMGNEIKKGVGHGAILYYGPGLISQELSRGEQSWIRWAGGGIAAAKDGILENTIPSTIRHGVAATASKVSLGGMGAVAISGSGVAMIAHSGYRVYKRRHQNTSNTGISPNKEKLVKIEVPNEHFKKDECTTTGKTTLTFYKPIEVTIEDKPSGAAKKSFKNSDGSYTVNSEDLSSGFYTLATSAATAAITGVALVNLGSPGLYTSAATVAAGVAPMVLGRPGFYVSVAVEAVAGAALAYGGYALYYNNLQ